MTSQITTPIAESINAAQMDFFEMLEARTEVESALINSYQKTWIAGRSLAALKEQIPHGEWAAVVTAKFAVKGKSDITIIRDVQFAMAFFAMNPNTAIPPYFTTESIRKCIFRIAPDKDRPQLEGDQPIRPALHPLTFVNNFLKWDRQAEIGLVLRPPVDVLRTDLEPVVKRIIELAGSEWIQGLL